MMATAIFLKPFPNGRVKKRDVMVRHPGPRESAPGV
jgi:hypothetical protein